MLHQITFQNRYHSENVVVNFETNKHMIAGAVVTVLGSGRVSHPKPMLDFASSPQSNSLSDHPILNRNCENGWKYNGSLLTLTQKRVLARAGGGGWGGERETFSYHFLVPPPPPPPFPLRLALHMPQSHDTNLLLLYI